MDEPYGNLENLSFNSSKNISTAWNTTSYELDYEGTSEFKTHYMSTARFIVECTAAAIAFLVNGAAFFWSRIHHHQHFAYYALYRNMTFTNAICAAVFWWGANSLYLTIGRLSPAIGISVMVGSQVLISLLGVVGTINVLLFSVVHYLAVCQPHTYSVSVTTKNMQIVLSLVWVVFCLLAFIPIVIIIILTARAGDDPTSLLDTLPILSIYAEYLGLAINILSFLAIIILCCIIQSRIKHLQARLAAFSWEDDLQLEKEVFRGILCLVATLALCYVPFNILFICSFHLPQAILLNNKAVIFYMATAPYIKFTADPILYKKSFVNFGLCWDAVAGALRKCCVDDSARRASLSTRVTRVEKEPRYRVAML